MAFRKPTWQDSTILNAAASRAVDGNDNPDFGASSCSHTAPSSFATWGVDLQVMAIIYSVEIMRRDYAPHGKFLQLYHVII